MRSEVHPKVGSVGLAALVGTPDGVAASTLAPSRPPTPGSDSSGSGTGLSEAPNVRSLVVQQLTKTKMCNMFARGVCDDSSCRFAHAREELRKAPDLTKTAICRAFQRGQCRNSECKFAHGEQELRCSPNVYKTQICHYFERGSCIKGNQCRHAHGSAELRPFEELASSESPPRTPQEQRFSGVPGRLAAATASRMGQPPSIGPTESRRLRGTGASGGLRQQHQQPLQPPSPTSFLVEPPTWPQTPPMGKDAEADRTAQQAPTRQQQQKQRKRQGAQASAMPDPMKVELPSMAERVRPSACEKTFTPLEGALPAPVVPLTNVVARDGSAAAAAAAAEAARRHQEQATVAYAMAARFAEFATQQGQQAAAAAASAAVLAALRGTISATPAGSLDLLACAAADAGADVELGAAQPYAALDSWGEFLKKKEAWAAAFPTAFPPMMPSMPPGFGEGGMSQHGSPAAATSRDLLQDYVDAWHPAIGARAMPSSWVA